MNCTSARVTPAMLEILMDCHERELMKHPPLNYRTQYIKGLVTRGLVADVMQVNAVSGKTELAFILTPKGRQFLQQKFNK